MNGKQAKQLRKIRDNLMKYHNLPPSEERRLMVALKKKFNSMTHQEKGNHE